MTEYKQAIVLNADLDMSEGKKVAQGCHACLKSYKKASNNVIEDWESSGSKKVVLEAEDEVLLERLERAKSLQIPAALVKDAGRTELDPGTVTALGVGPGAESEIDSVTGDLKLVD